MSSGMLLGASANSGFLRASTGRTPMGDRTRCGTYRGRRNPRPDVWPRTSGCSTVARRVVGEHVWGFADFRTRNGIHRADGNRKGVFTRERRPKAAARAVRRGGASPVGASRPLSAEPSPQASAEAPW
ncbi:glycoside hydrolase family 2 TIM barrel-domain containing protein [Streptomyces sp. NPDC086519]|uniref:glycoside hydrolase family 2 TIM barrel-domain containing protein n=1 Tax=Streptomyces sp. NPDC086519 TaxID=3154863 RepID=UPI0034124532